MPTHPARARLSCAALLACAVALPARAAEILVDVLGDPVPDGCTPGSCSLREAVALANATSGPDRILLPITQGQPLQLTRPGNDDSNSGGDLDIRDDLEIVGKGSEQTVLVQTIADRLFDTHMPPQGRLSLRAFRIEGGRGGDGGAVRSSSTLRVDGMRLRNNHAVSSGGAIWLDAPASDAPIAGSRLTVLRSRFDDNSSTPGSEILQGGAIFVLSRIDNGKLLWIEDSDFVANESGGGGGAISVEDWPQSRGGDIHVQGSRFTDNASLTGDTLGGAIGATVDNQRLDIVDSVFVGNAARTSGGAVAAFGGRTNVVRSGFRENTAEAGGGLYLTRGTVVDSELCSNPASHNGGGLFGAGPLTVRGSTFCFNSAGDSGAGGGAIAYSGEDATLRIERSTFTGNGASKGGAIRLIRGELELFSSTIVAPTLIPQGSLGIAIHHTDSDGGGILVRNSIINGSCFFTQFPSMIAFDNIHTGTDTCRLDDAFLHGGNQLGVTTAALALQPLADNGGPTRTQLPGASSVAVDTGGAVDCSAADQRGYLRIDDDCDVGAIERGALPPGPLFGDGFE